MEPKELASGPSVHPVELASVVDALGDDGGASYKRSTRNLPRCSSDSLQLVISASSAAAAVSRGAAAPCRWLASSWREPRVGSGLHFKEKEGAS